MKQERIASVPASFLYPCVVIEKDVDYKKMRKYAQINTPYERMKQAYIIYLN